MNENKFMEAFKEKKMVGSTDPFSEYDFNTSKNADN